jgi:gliding motility-associated-like protein
MVSLSLSSAACSHAVQKPIYTYPLANISYIVDTAICFGTTIPIEAVGNFTSIQWNPAEYFENSFEAKTNVSLPYSMFVKAALESPFGCESVDSVFIYVQQKPYYLGAPDSLLLYYFTEDSLRFTSDVSSNLIVGETYNVNNIIIDGVLYSWTPATYLNCDDCGSPDIDLRCGIPGFPNCLDFPETVDYTITMTDRLGCFENTETITFSIILETKAALPQAFTPNNDGVNDFAFVRGWGIKEFLELRIYNRWGQQVFMTTNIEKGWDGTFRGEPQNADTYAYTIKVINTNNEEEFIKGYITLLR